MENDKSFCWEIRPWQVSDAPGIAKALNNPKVQANLRDGLPYPYSAKDAEEYIQSTLDALKDSTFLFAVVVNGEAAGSIGIFRQSNIHRRTAELGYYLAEPYWGKGIMSQAVRNACDTLFETTDLLRIFADPFTTNVGSCRVLEKAGFSREGLLRCNAVKNNEIKDMYIYARLRERALPKKEA